MLGLKIAGTGFILFLAVAAILALDNRKPFRTPEWQCAYYVGAIGISSITVVSGLLMACWGV